MFLAAQVASLALALTVQLEQHRFALVVGDSHGGAGTRDLHYADRDAERMYAILTRLGGVHAEDARLLEEVDEDQFKRALEDLSRRAAAARARGEPTLLLVYYSGHAKDGSLRLGGSRLPMSELRTALEAAPADVRIGLIDSCQSGVITRPKGARIVPAFDVQGASAAAAPHGLVLITSSTADEESAESDEISGSFFTHYLASGLLGDADSNRDGQVTLAEAYAYAFGKTVGGTADTVGGTQHPVYLYDLGGAGDIVLTNLNPAQGGLLFVDETEGDYLVLDPMRRAVAEIAKDSGSSRKLALPPGKYTVKKKLPDHLLVGQVAVGDTLTPVADENLKSVKLEDDPQKGSSGPEWSVFGTVGYQAFFDYAARTDLFPPAVLGGVELGVRGDLGAHIAWGFDLSAGAGSSTLSLENLSPIPVRFTEFTGGASLWRDIPFRPLTLSLGARVAFIDMIRNFPGHPELQSQYFFTITPGLQATLSWQITGSLSLAARGRVNYLFYNIDAHQSLGYAEFAIGAAYAFGN
jgi:Caspase domain